MTSVERYLRQTLILEQSRTGGRTRVAREVVRSVRRDRVGRACRGRTARDRRRRANPARPGPRQQRGRELRCRRGGARPCAATARGCGGPFRAAVARRSRPRLARLALARALRHAGRRSVARDEAQAARKAFRRLGATHGVELASRLLAGLEDEAGAQPASTAGPHVTSSSRSSDCLLPA